MRDLYRGNSALRAQQKRERREQILVSITGFLSLAATALVLITLVNWAIIGVFSAYQ
jgi:Flp pilus assembly protein TadB